jgi:hypothetical protein
MIERDDPAYADGQRKAYHRLVVSASHWPLVHACCGTFMFLLTTRQLDASALILSSCVNEKCRASDMRRRYDSIVVAASG